MSKKRMDAVEALAQYHALHAAGDKAYRDARVLTQEFAKRNARFKRGDVVLLRDEQIKQNHYFRICDADAVRPRNQDKQELRIIYFARKCTKDGDPRAYSRTTLEEGEIKLISMMK